jgi:hypothetical protein
MLSALPGAESQLQSHMRVSMNVGLTTNQLRQLTQVLADRVIRHANLPRRFDRRNSRVDENTTDE